MLSTCVLCNHVREKTGRKDNTNTLRFVWKEIFEEDMQEESVYREKTSVDLGT